VVVRPLVFFHFSANLCELSVAGSKALDIAMRASRRTRFASWLPMLLVLSSSSLGFSAKTSSAHEWHFYGGDAGGVRSSPLKQINRGNVAKLKRAWTYHTGELNMGTGQFEAGRIPAF